MPRRAFLTVTVHINMAHRLESHHPQSPNKETWILHWHLHAPGLTTARQSNRSINFDFEVLKGQTHTYRKREKRKGHIQRAGTRTRKYANISCNEG